MIFKRKTILVLVLIFLLSLTLVSFGLDLDSQGSISIRLKDSSSKELLEGFEFAIYKVADAYEADQSLAFKYTSEFEKNGHELNLDNPELALELALYADMTGLTGLVKKDSDGLVVFEDQLPGLYLVVQKAEAEGYYPVDPFLVSLPVLSSGKWIYKVEASPKVQARPVTPPKPDPKPEGSTPPLISTGLLRWPIPVLVGLGLVLFALGWIKSRGGKSEGYEG